MDLFTSKLFAKMPRPAPFEAPSAPLPPLPPVAAATPEPAVEQEEEGGTLDTLFPWMFPQEAPRAPQPAAPAQPPPYRPRA